MTIGVAWNTWGETIPTGCSQRSAHLILNPQVTGGRGGKAVNGIIACSTSFPIRSQLVQTRGLHLREYPRTTELHSVFGFESLCAHFFPFLDYLIEEMVKDGTNSRRHSWRVCPSVGEKDYYQIQMASRQLQC